MHGESLRHERWAIQQTSACWHDSHALDNNHVQILNMCGNLYSILRVGTHQTRAETEAVLPVGTKTINDHRLDDSSNRYTPPYGTPLLIMLLFCVRATTA